MTTSANKDIGLLPKSSGTYALISYLAGGRLIQVGKLGTFEFPAGYYLYTGSAFGPGGLAGRLGRHLAASASAKSLHWHIDYLRQWASIVAVWFQVHSIPREHDWATQAELMAGGRYPAPRFGASDCRCPSHLFYFAQPPTAERFSSSLNRTFPTDPPLKMLQFDKENRPA
ncbi:MAG: GIY-YIG nuclease family protein [Chloroflexota bacterium]|jgi:Uri superfamily endonuclease